jgi:hypothetical protein
MDYSNPKNRNQISSTYPNKIKQKQNSRIDIFDKTLVKFLCSKNYLIFVNLFLIVIFSAGCGKFPSIKKRRKKFKKSYPANSEEQPLSEKKKQNKRKAFSLEEEINKCREYFNKKYKFDPERNYEDKTPKQIKKIYKNELKKRISKKFPLKKLVEVRKKAERKYKTLNIGDKVTVNLRFGAGYRDYTGEFKGASGQKLKIGNKFVFKKDIPQCILDRLSPDKIENYRKEYINTNYYTPKEKYSKKASRKTCSFIKKKYGYFYDSGEWTKIKDYIEYHAKAIAKSPGGLKGYLDKKEQQEMAELQAKLDKIDEENKRNSPDGNWKVDNTATMSCFMSNGLSKAQAALEIATYYDMEMEIGPNGISMQNDNLINFRAAYIMTVRNGKTYVKLPETLEGRNHYLKHFSLVVKSNGKLVLQVLSGSKKGMALIFKRIE